MRNRVEVLKLIRLSDGCYDRVPVRKAAIYQQYIVKNLFQSRVMSRSSLRQSNEVFVTRKLGFCGNAQLTGNKNSSVRSVQKPDYTSTVGNRKITIFTKCFRFPADLIGALNGPKSTNHNINDLFAHRLYDANLEFIFRQANFLLHFPIIE